MIAALRDAAIPLTVLAAVAITTTISAIARHRRRNRR